MLTLPAPAPRAGFLLPEDALHEAVAVWSTAGTAEEPASVAAAALRAMVAVGRIHPIAVDRVLSSLLSSAFSERPAPAASAQSLAAATALAMAHPSLLQRALPPLLDRVHTLLPGALTGSAAAVDGVALALSALARIVGHYTGADASPSAPPRARPAVASATLPRAVRVDLAVYVCGLLYVCAARATGKLDDRVVAFALQCATALAASLDAEEQRHLLGLLSPALTSPGGASALVTAYQRAAAALLCDAPVQERRPSDERPPRDASAPQAAPPSLSPMKVSVIPPLLQRVPAALQQALCVFASVLGCARPSLGDWPHQSDVMDALMAFLSGGNEVRPTLPQQRKQQQEEAVCHAAAVHLFGCALNKLPLGHPHLQVLLDSVLLKQFATIEQSLAGEGASAEALGPPLSIAAVSVKALLMRGHPTSAPLLSRYLALPFTAAALSDDATGLSAWASGVSLLVTDFPLLLSRASHAVQGPGLMYKQRVLALALPDLLGRVDACRASKRQIALQRVNPADAESGSEPTSAAAADRDDRLATALLLAVLHLVSPLPFSLVEPHCKQLLPSLMLAIASRSSTCRMAGLHVLHGLLRQKMDVRLLADHSVLLLPFLLAVVKRSIVDGDASAEEGSAQAVVCALQCLATLRALPFSLLYPHRTSVLRALSSCVDQRSRSVRQEAIAVNHLWSALTHIQRKD